MDNKNYAIIVAGGSGARMGGDVAKQFMELGGKPVIATTVERFLSLSFPLCLISLGILKQTIIGIHRLKVHTVRGYSVVQQSP